MRTLACCLLLGGLAGPLLAQDDPSLASYRAARAVLDAALEAHGGRDRILGLRALTVRHTGTNTWRNQSPSAAGPLTETPTSGVLAVDLAGRRLFWESRSEYPGGFRNHATQMIDGARSFGTNPIEGRWFASPNARFENQLGLLRRVPQFVLVGALERATQLRHAGRVTIDGRPHDLITYPSTDGAQLLTLAVDASTHLLRSFDQLYTDVQTGDAVARVEFLDYTMVEGLALPQRRTITRAGATFEDVRLTDHAVNTLDSTLFERPTGLVDGTGGAEAPTEVRQLAAGVYHVPGVAGGNSSLAVLQEEGWLVVEAYGSEQASQRTLRLLDSLAPGRPVRHLVPTHHHDDHTGGVRTFIARGATIVGTPGNRGWFETLAAARYTLAPDEQERARAPLRWREISGQRMVLGTGDTRVELHDIGPSPHAEEMVVAYLPAHRILVQGDLLNLPADGRLRAGNLTSRHFLGWIDRSGLAIETIIPVHGPPHTVARLREAVALMDR